MNWVIGAVLVGLCGCHSNRPQFIVDPYVLELSNLFVDIRHLSRRDGYKLIVIELDDYDKLKKITNTRRSTIVSPLLGMIIDDEVVGDNIWLLKDNEAPYLFSYSDAQKLLGPSLRGESTSLVLYSDEKDKEMIADSGLLGKNVIYHHLDEQVNYKALFSRYAARGFDYVIVMQRNFPIDIDTIIIEEQLHRAIYITDRLSKSSHPYYFLAKDYNKMMNQFKNSGDKRVYNYLYLIK